MVPEKPLLSPSLLDEIDPMATALLYLGVLVASGEIAGFGHNLFLAVSRLVFMGGASVVLLLNTLDLRQSLATVRRLHREAEVRAKDFARLNGELQAMADLLVDIRSTDRLTGLRTRPYFQEKIAGEEVDVSPLPMGERHRQDLLPGAGFLLFGLDHLDLLKSLHGESAGDLALEHVEQLLLGHTRVGDTVVRWGESELLTFLPRIESDQIQAVAEKIRSALRSRTFKLGTQKTTALSVSVGTSFLAPAEHSRKSAWWEGIAAAEAALAATQQVT